MANYTTSKDTQTVLDQPKQTPAFAFDLSTELKKSLLLPDGVYRCEITQAYCVLDVDGNADHVILTFDITHGAYAGVFDGLDSGDGDPETARNRGVRLTVNPASNKGRAYAARSIATIMECNPGFDPSDALAHGGWRIFVGKVVGVKVGHREYNGVTYNDFSFTTLDEVPAPEGGE